MTDFRKAGADLLRITQSASDPAAEANKALLYAKDSAGATKIFMRDSAGTVLEVGTGGGGGSGDSLQVVASTILGAPASTISVSGLDGDSDEEYEIEFNYIATLLGSHDIDIRPNGTTGSDRWTTRRNGAAVFTNSGGILAAHGNVSTGTVQFRSRIRCWVKRGTYRRIFEMLATVVYDSSQVADWESWTNYSDESANLTSLTIGVLNGFGNQFAAGSELIVRKKVTGGGSGGFVGNAALPEQWSAVAIPASASNVTMSAQVDTTGDAVAMIRSGSVTGLSVKLSTPVTAGTVTVRITKNGTPGTLLVVLSTGQSVAQVTQSAPLDTYVSGDLIGLVYSTSGTLTPVGSIDIEAWVQTSEAGVPVSAGGTTAWASGTYSTGQTVTRGPYVWRANNTTNEDPLVDEGNLGNADWTLVATGGAGALQTPGAANGAPNGNVRLINNATGSSATVYRQSVNSGFLGKMLMVDLQISGIADWIHFGLYDSSAAQTASDILASGTSPFYGVNIFIYTPSTAKIENIINGVVATNLAYSNANSTNAGSGYSRWYLKMIQNGANWDLELLRPRQIAGSNPYTPGFDPNQEDDLLPITRFTNVARPSFTNWRFLIGARTGGSAGTFGCRAAYVRNLISGNWTAISKLPTGI